MRTSEDTLGSISKRDLEEIPLKMLWKNPNSRVCKFRGEYPEKIPLNQSRKNLVTILEKIRGSIPGSIHTNFLTSNREKIPQGCSGMQSKRNQYRNIKMEESKNDPLQESSESLEEIWKIPCMNSLKTKNNIESNPCRHFLDNVPEKCLEQLRESLEESLEDFWEECFYEN